MAEISKTQSANAPARAAWRAPLVAAMCLLTAAGCTSTLSVSDAVRMEGTPSLLSAYAERTDLLGEWHGVAGVEVTFLVDGKEVARAVTDADGYASKRVTLPTAATHFTAEATIGIGMLQHEGVIYPWAADRTIIVFDIDGTVCDTNFEELFLRKSNEGSVPIEGAQETLQELSSRFNIGYISARPRILLKPTKEWLAQYDFPPGPVLTASSIDEGLHAERFKAKAIREHKAAVPNILIGIGNLDSDSEAYAANGLLTLIRHEDDDKSFRAHAIVLPDWAQIRQFFLANGHVLENPDKLRQAIKEGHMLTQPQFPYAPRR